MYYIYKHTHTPTQHNTHSNNRGNGKQPQYHPCKILFKTDFNQLETKVEDEEGGR